MSKILFHILFTTQLRIERLLEPAKMGNKILTLFPKMASVISKARICPLAWCPDSSSLHHLLEYGGVDDVAKLRRKFLIKHNLSKIFLVCLVWQEVGSFWRKFPFTISTKILNWFAILTLTAYNVCLHVCHCKSHEIIECTTELFRFLGKYKSDSASGNQQQNVMKEKLAKYLGRLAMMGILVILSGYVFGLHWKNPEKKVSLVGYWLLWSSGSALGMLLKFSVFFVNYLSCQVNVIAAQFCIFNRPAPFCS